MCESSLRNVGFSALAKDSTGEAERSILGSVAHPVSDTSRRFSAEQATNHHKQYYRAHDPRGDQPAR